MMTKLTAEKLEGLSLIRLAEYKRRYGLREVRKIACACILTGSRKCIDRDAECHAPYCDHPSLFKSNATGELVLVYQPYVPIDDSTGYLDRFTKRVEAWAAIWAVIARVSAEESWHYPGRTMLVELRKAVRS
jgi:hypothetical protein